MTHEELETLARLLEESADHAVRRAALAVRARREALDLALQLFEDVIPDSVDRGPGALRPFAFDFDSEALDSWWDGPQSPDNEQRPRLRLVRRPGRAGDAD